MLNKELNTALKAVTDACSVAQFLQNSLTPEDILCKEDTSPVTLADFCCQAIINYQLHEAFPDDEIMGEESDDFLKNPTYSFLAPKIAVILNKWIPSLSATRVQNLLSLGNSKGGKQRFWTIDPIDGTKGYLRHEQYAVAVSLIEDGKVILGVLGCPHLVFHEQQGVHFFALRNQGAYGISFEDLKKYPVHVSKETKAENVIYCEPHFSSRSHSHSKAAQIAAIIKAHPKPFQMDSQCKYGLVANGQASIYLRLPNEGLVYKKHSNEKIWDHAAGSIIVEEAGGKVTDALGQDLDFSLGQNLSNRLGVIATNGFLHEQVINASRTVFLD